MDRIYQIDKFKLERKLKLLHPLLATLTLSFDCTVVLVTELSKPVSPVR